MPILVEVSARYQADPDQLFQSALRFSEMAEAMAGLASYSGLPESDTANEGDTIFVDVTFLRLFRQTGHRIHIERLDKRSRIIQSRESGNGIKRWDHTLSIQSENGLSRWSDTIVIDAGWRTAMVARFAAYMYRRRHRRRQALSIVTRLAGLPG